MMSNKHKNKNNKANNEQMSQDDNVIVEITDEDGNVYLYEEEMIIPIEDKNFALLAALPFESDDNNIYGSDDDEVIIAKIVTNDDGEEEYIEPTEAEFEMVMKAYEDYFDDEEWAKL